MENEPLPKFGDLGLSPAALGALEDIGYECPSPIQARIIPLILEGRDVIGQAQTGTGKTAAFALPLLSRLDLGQAKRPQILTLAPTRELALQVAEAFKKYGSGIDGFRVLPVYGGQAMEPQLRQLARGVHVVVGTPGRVMDHMRRGTLGLEALGCLVLDEADEMLRMGFIDDVKWILERAPQSAQIALFSATMPPPIRKIAERRLRDPAHVAISSKTATADTVRQRFWMASGLQKLDALTRLLETERFEAMLVFVRTKRATAELAERLEARGFAAEALNGDVPQRQRERLVEALKSGRLDILVATDVAARGLDVERVSHVVNYDIPCDVESYVHRIGRTGRAGRSGEAILFVSPRERRLLQTIERGTKSRIERMEMPTATDVADRRSAAFFEKLSTMLGEEGLDRYRDLIERFRIERDVPSLEIAAALAKRLLEGQGESRPLSGRDEKRLERSSSAAPSNSEGGGAVPKREERRAGGATSRPERKARPAGPPSAFPEGMERFRLEAGRSHGVEPGQIVGAIANEAGLEGRYIGRIEIFDNHSLVELPVGMPREILHLLKKTWVAGQPMRLSRVDAAAPGKSAGGRDAPKRKS